jgi:hypothetical protein
MRKSILCVLLLAIVCGIVYGAAYLKLSRDIDSRLGESLSWPATMLNERVALRLEQEAPTTGVDDEAPWIQIWNVTGDRLLVQSYKAFISSDPADSSHLSHLNTALTGTTRRETRGRFAYRMRVEMVQIGSVPLIVQVAESEAAMQDFLLKLEVIMLLTVASLAIGIEAVRWILERSRPSGV